MQVGGSVAPIFAGSMLAYATTRNDLFYIAGGLKLVYDFLLLISFRSTPTAEEKQKADHAAQRQTSENASILPKKQDINI